MALYNETRHEFAQFGAQMIGFVIDSGGVIRWSYVSPVGVNPGADGILEALEQIAGKVER